MHVKTAESGLLNGLVRGSETREKVIDNRHKVAMVSIT